MKAPENTLVIGAMASARGNPLGFSQREKKAAAPLPGYNPGFQILREC
jgi:hypothetical protein